MVQNCGERRQGKQNMVNRYKGVEMGGCMELHHSAWCVASCNLHKYVVSSTTITTTTTTTTTIELPASQSFPRELSLWTLKSKKTKKLHLECFENLNHTM
jgi:hypothetical protein